MSGGGVNQRAEALDQAPRVAFVPRRGEHDGRLALGREREDLFGHGQRVEEEQLLPVVEGVRRNRLRPPLVVRPLGVRRLPVPEPVL